MHFIQPYHHALRVCPIHCVGHCIMAWYKIIKQKGSKIPVTPLESVA